MKIDVSVARAVLLFLFVIIVLTFSFAFKPFFTTEPPTLDTKKPQFSVNAIVFDDPSSHDKHKLYIIKNLTTGREYIGVDSIDIDGLNISEE